MAINVNTLREYLDDKKWLFFERGLQAVWNELDQLADSALVGTPATFADTDFVSNCNPDVVLQTPRTGRENAAGTLFTSPPSQFR